MSIPHATRNGLSHEPAESELDLVSADERLEEEMRRLAALNEELMGKVRPNFKETQVPDESDEVGLLRLENEKLRAHIHELEEALQESESTSSWSERQKEYEALLEEKSEVIRTLHLRVHELQEGPVSSAPVAAAKDSPDVQRMKKELEEQRLQLEEDEKSLMQQMRQMEMAMSKDRAELARQRNEIQRLHNELNREIDMASRDPGLRERLIALQRLQGEVNGRKQPPSPTPTRQPIPARQAAPAQAPPAEPAKKQSSGLLRRIFGK